MGTKHLLNPSGLSQEKKVEIWTKTFVSVQAHALSKLVASPSCAHGLDREAVDCDRFFLEHA